MILIGPQKGLKIAHFRNRIKKMRKIKKYDMLRQALLTRRFFLNDGDEIS